jgi:hypothetical protein
MTTIRRNGCDAKIFETDANGWVIQIGMNTYGGYASEAEAVAAVPNFI